jgi:hypothetical protein
MRINVLSPIKRSLPLVIFSAFLAFTTPAKAEDNVFTSAEFLEWERKQQDFYIQVSINMAALIAVPNDKKQADCIDNWYNSKKETRNEFILGVMKDNPDYHPHGILIGVLQKNCGDFKYN